MIERVATLAALVVQVLGIISRRVAVTHVRRTWDHGEQRAVGQMARGLFRQQLLNLSVLC